MEWNSFRGQDGHTVSITRFDLPIQNWPLMTPTQTEKIHNQSQAESFKHLLALFRLLLLPYIDKYTSHRLELVILQLRCQKQPPKWASINSFNSLIRTAKQGIHHKETHISAS